MNSDGWQCEVFTTSGRVSLFQLLPYSLLGNDKGPDSLSLSLPLSPLGILESTKILHVVSGKISRTTKNMDYMPKA